MATTGPGSGQATTSQLASDATRLVRTTAYTQIDNQKHRATDMLGSLAHAVRSTGDQLRDGNSSFIAGYADRAAEQIDRFSHALGNRELDDLVHDVRTFARERPALFLAAAFGLGVLAARFLKSSNARTASRTEQRERPAHETAGAWSTPQPAGGAATRPYVAHDMPGAAPDRRPGSRVEVDRKLDTGSEG
jgi:hypothetical protein